MHNELIISSKENPNIRLYQKLAASKKERQANGLFVLEGFRLVQDALREHTELTLLMMTQAASEKYADDFSQADLKEVRALIISNELGRKIAETEKTQGVFAVCRMPEQPVLSRSLLPGGRYLVLHQLQDPGNAGMILRTADAIGIDGVICCECCELFSPKSIRATMGSVFRVPVWQGLAIESVLADLKAAGIPTFAAVIDADARELRTCDFSKGAAVLIGNEGNGLPPEVSGACDTRATIRMHGNINSLNAAMAAGIFL